MPNPSISETPPSTLRRTSPVVAIVGALAVVVLNALLLALALGGIGVMLIHARALALLAVWGAGGITLALLQPVRRHDPQSLKQESKFSLVMMLVLPLLTPPLAALGERLGLFLEFAKTPAEWAGVAAVALGLAIRIAGMVRLGSRFSPLVAVQQDHALETHGIYAVVRHPGYLGALLACVGGMVAFGSALALPLVAAFAGLLQARIAREEVLLEQHFGEAFLDYRRRVGGLLPRLWPARAPRSEL